MSLITIGIPTYNRKEYLQETLKTVFAQSFKDFEVIIVDDGSTDGTKEFINTLDYPVQYFWKENGGDASARNEIIEKTNSKYITFIDSDDLLFEDTVENLYNAIKDAGGEACAYGQYIGIDENGIELKTKGKLKVYPSGTITNDLFQHIFVHSCGSMFPTKALKDLGGFDKSIKVCSDYKMWLYLSVKYNFIPVSSPTFKRRRHAGNLSAANYAKKNLGIDVLNEFYESVGKDLLNKEDVNKRFAIEYYRAGKLAKKERLMKEAKIAFKKSLSYKFNLKCFIKYLF